MSWKETMLKRVEKGNLKPKSAGTYIYIGEQFEKWLQSEKNLSLDKLIESKDINHVCELLGEYVNVYHKDFAFHTKRSTIGAVYAIFSSHNLRLPSGSKTTMGVTAKYTEEEITKGSEEEIITLDEFRKIVVASDPMERAVLLTMFQSFMDVSTLCEKFNYMWHIVGKDIIAKNYPIRVTFLGGRKTNPFKYYTILDKDAVEAICTYVTEHRPNGIPKENEPIFLQSRSRGGVRSPIDSHSIWRSVKSIVFFLGLSKKYRGKGKFRPHEIRDTARSLWGKARSELGIDDRIADFFMGHKVDPLFYNKMTSDWDWVKNQLEKIRPHINVLSGKPSIATKEDIDRLRLEQITMWASEEGLTVEQYLTRKMEKLGIKASVEDVGIDEAIRMVLELKAKEKKTEHNGGSTQRFECKIIDATNEQELTELVSMGWEIVKELSNGKIVLRKEVI